LHVPLTRETTHIIKAARLALMKTTAILINTARGALVDQSALVEALRNQEIFGAGIDVFETEPPSRDNPPFGLTNTVLSDHTAWYSEESVTELQTKAAEEVVRVFRGERPKHWVATKNACASRDMLSPWLTPPAPETVSTAISSPDFAPETLSLRRRVIPTPRRL
jgi:phosphoglycerate dehydrogenase-like enzyme